MERLTLPPRLAAIAALVPPGARLADVGTDHGLLPIWLLEQGIIRSAVATDIRPGPLARAASLMEERGAGPMDCRLCDGLALVSPGDADTIVIAGMGGDNIASILARASWTREGTRLILQPMSRGDVLRRELLAQDFCVSEEHLVYDSGRLYSILTAEGGPSPVYSEAEYHTGRYALVGRDPLFIDLLDVLEKKISAAREGLRRAKEPEPEKTAYLEQIYGELEQMRREYHDNGTGDRPVSGREDPAGAEGKL